MCEKKTFMKDKIQTHFVLAIFLSCCSTIARKLQLPSSESLTKFICKNFYIEQHNWDFFMPFANWYFTMLQNSNLKTFEFMIFYNRKERNQEDSAVLPNGLAERERRAARAAAGLLALTF
jgi:hypothetical protein